MELSIVIPACNEEKRIRDTLLNYAKFFRESGIKYEIIVEMDGCVDKTAEVVRTVSSVYPEIKALEYSEKLGKGGGLIKGLQLAKGEYVGFVDADGSTEPAELMKLLDRVEKGADCAIGSRHMKGSVVLNQSKSRKVLSKCFNIMVRTLFALPYHDTQCGAKMYRSSALPKILSEIHVNGFIFDVVLLYLTKKNGFTVVEVPIRWEDKAGSKVSVLFTTLDMLNSIIRLRLHFSPLRRWIAPSSKKHTKANDMARQPR